ncbi:bifunctional phosphoribosylaminoimidazolecarboxamide formyltransferase/IMP cyclohydrolase [Salisaeta longa]|uniref:bifunctional phosphoribosylaminoimidazolecarboxamide formyltransferase/IMP cyclohydrolase n=1 Tax=Salisaeta longa TaxID=503170 RepID=UPI0003B787BC|nr:bifunctional phosphoribosylaminoimidazolecarboxamide formyltransferase/IMP cyclohydrolase [Salisaeta longa]
MIPAKDLPPPDDHVRVQRALLSVYDKTGIAALGAQLHAHGIELLSTGGTAQALRDADLPVTDVADVTGSPELLDGRVKSLHPAIHAGLLARRTDPSDMDDLAAHGIAPIDLVVGNLYPFDEAVTPATGAARAMENVDIGGPTMLRAAAKNYFFVGVVTAPSLYEALVEELNATEGHLTLDTRRALAEQAFAHTAAYDRHIHRYFAAQHAQATDAASAGEANDTTDALPSELALHEPHVQTLRYGENPHQQAALYGTPTQQYTKLHGKDLSFNNLMDLSAALRLIDEFRDAPPTCAILKHTNPCGVATADTLEEAHAQAFATDRQSPFGGIVVVNRTLDRATAEAIDAIFTEIIIAPDFADGVLGFLQEKKRRRIVRATAPARTDARLDVRSALGGVLAQTPDAALPPAEDTRNDWTVVTERAPTDAEWADIDFAWRVAKHVKSNAIVYAKDRHTLGIGAGQMSRIDASELAVMKSQKSELDLDGSVVASDAFFPFADGLEAAARAGARVAVQPGGSIRDDEVIEAANAHDMAMVMTGQRHFRH